MQTKWKALSGVANNFVTICTSFADCRNVFNAEWQSQSNHLTVLKFHDVFFFSLDFVHLLFFLVHSHSLFNVESVGSRHLPNYSIRIECAPSFL